MSIGHVVKQHRVKIGYTQDQLASQTGISKPYLSNIETGRIKNPPSDHVLASLEQALLLPCGTLSHFAHLERTPPDIREEHERLRFSLQQLRQILRELLKDPSPRNRRLARKWASPADPLLEAASRWVPEMTLPVLNNAGEPYPEFQLLRNRPPGFDSLRCPGIQDGQAFALRVVGDQMLPQYAAGDIVAFSPATQPQSGDDCFILLADNSRGRFLRYYADSPETVRLQPLDPRYPAEIYPREDVLACYPAVLRIHYLKQENS